MVKAGNPLRGVFVVAPSGTAQLNHFIGSFPERGYAANPPSVCLSRPLVSRMSLPRFSRAMSVFPAKAGIYVTPTATPSKVRAATKPIPKITQIKRITVQDQAPPNQSPHHHPHPSFQRKPQPTPPPHLPYTHPRRSGRQPNESQKSPKSNESQFKTKRPPPVFPAKPRAPTAPSVCPRVAVDATPPNRLSSESRNLRHPQPQPLRRSGRQPNQSSKITQIKRITVQDQAPPPATTPPPHPSFRRKPEPTPPPHLPYTHESP